MKVVSLYVDQKPEGDQSAERAKEFGFQVYPTIAETLRCGGPRIAVDAIIVTTGPAHGNILRSQPFLAALEKAGVLTPCETGLGIACDLHARAVGADGLADQSLFIAGPLARGTFGELMGLPQVTEHAVFVAGEIEALLAVDPLSSKAGERVQR